LNSLKGEIEKERSDSREEENKRMKEMEEFFRQELKRVKAEQEELVIKNQFSAKPGGLANNAPESARKRKKFRCGEMGKDGIGRKIMRGNTWDKMGKVDEHEMRRMKQLDVAGLAGSARSTEEVQNRFKFSHISSGMFGVATEFGKFFTVSRGGAHPVGVREEMAGALLGRLEVLLVEV
jgi:hypothetical protein